MTYLRVVRFSVLLVVLVSLLGLSWYVRRAPQGTSRPNGPRLFETRFDEAAFQPDASADEFLALAQRTATRLIAEFPDDPGAFSVQARRHYLLSETETARQLWEECIRRNSHFAEAYFGLGLLALDNEQYSEATEHFEEVAHLDAKDPRVPVLLAKSLLLGGRAEDAILILEQHVTTQRTSAEAWEMLGQAYLQTQVYDRAAECFEVAVDAVPTMKDAVYGLARAYASSGESEKANLYAERFRQLSETAQQETIEDAKAFQDRNFAAHVAAQTHADAARVYHRHNRVEQGEEMQLRAVLLEPGNLHFLEDLQQMYQRRGAYAEAAEVGERIVQLEPEKVEQWLNLGWLYSHLNQPDQAIVACEKAIALRPDDPRCREAYEAIQKAR